MANAAAQRILGFEGEALSAEAFSRSRWDVVDEDGRPVERDRLPEQVVLRTGEPQEGIVQGIRQPDGDVLWVSVNAQPVLRDGNDEPASVVVSFIDVSEQREAEAALQRYAEELAHSEAAVRDTNAFLQSTLDALDAHVAILDEEGTILSVNAAWERFGRSNGLADPAQGVGTNYLGLCDACTPLENDADCGEGHEGAAEVAAGIRRVLDGELDQFTHEYPCHGPDENRWFLLRVTRFEGGDGPRLVLAHENVTVVKQAEQALQRYADALEAKTGELERANEALEERNRELEQFAYVASHDLQEPLRMVSSFLQLLQRRYAGQLDEKAEEYIEYAVDGARRMQRLIQDLLAFSRVGTRGQAFEPVDLEDTLAVVLRDLGPKVEEEGAAVEAGDLPVVQGDPTQLGQLFQNLIANALKFRTEEPPRVRIWAERAGPMWEVAVADNGIGIDPKYTDRVFQIFQRLHTRDEYEGTGIGLALCKKIVERHGGDIWFENDPDVPGTTFYFTLPTTPS